MTVICSSCKREFILKDGRIIMTYTQYNSDQTQVIIVRCPHCEYEEILYDKTEYKKRT